MKVIFFLLLFTSVCYAKQNVYYDPETKKEVVDLSGALDSEEVKKEYGLSDKTQVVTLDESQEAHKITNGKLVKYDRIKEKEKVDNAKKDSKEEAKRKVKLKFNIDDEEFEFLKEAVQ